MPHLSYQTHGDAGNPSLLFLHGFMSCNAQWMLNVPVLREAFHCVTCELWGHGDSPCPDESLFTIEAYVREFERIRMTLGIERWGVIGQSYGAGLVCHYALACRDRCHSVVVTNSRSAFGSIEPRDRRRPRADGPARGDSAPDIRSNPLHPINARRFPDEVKAALVAAADRMDARTIALTGRLAGELNFIDRLGDLPQPVLLTNGRFEKGFQAEVAALRARYPALQTVDLDGGHSVNIEAAPGFNRAVMAFLQDNHQP